VNVVSRRTFLAGTLSAVLTISTLRFVQTRRALGGAIALAVDDWLLQVQRLSAAVKEGRITPRAWRRQVQRLTQQVPLAEILRVTDFSALATDVDAVEGAEPQRMLTFPIPSGTSQLAFTAILSRIRERFAVVPHGHHNMVSMHLILKGAVRLRQYDRLQDDPAYLVLRPVADRVCRPGDTSAISADRGNVHWFQGLEDSFALIVAAYDLDAAAGPTARDYVDPLEAERQADGSLHAPRLTLDDAYRRYLQF
jgi:hypothetical protein